MDLLIANFQFLRPLWLLIIIPTLILIFLLMKQKNKQGQWHQIFPAHLANLLIETKSVVHQKKSMTVLILASFIIAIALAGPTWERVEQPLFKIKKAQVVITDMSLSMYATDLAPNRLTRAKFKLNDLVSRLGEGDTAMIAYAGDAFVISPMTQDVANLKNLIPALSPDIMPVYGSAPAYAIEKALELFEQSNHNQGDIYLITDGIEGSDVREITQLLNNTQFTLSIMGIGTAQGAPIKLPNDQLLKNDSGNIVIPKLQSSLLRGLSSKLGGRYSNLTNDASDIDYLTSIPESTNLDNQEQDNQFGDEWHEVGPYLILLLLPFAALAFRRGVLMSIALLMITFNPLESSPVMAAESTQPLQTPNNQEQEPMTSWWNDLWETKNQQALTSYKNNRFDDAASTFEDSQWRGAAQYKQGNYEQALESFNRENTPHNLFNQGNTFAKMEQFEEAIRRYEKLLKQDPDFPNAQENLDLVKALSQQKKDQEKQQGDKSDDNGDNKEKSDQEQKDDQESSDSDDNKDGEKQDQESDQKPEDSQSKSNDDKSDSKDGSDKQEQEQEQSGDKSDKESDDESDEQQPLTEEEKKQQKEQLKKQKQAAKESQELFDNENLTPDQLQRLNQLVKKIPDNPSLLLQQKMKHEARKRQHMRVTTKERKQW